MSNSIYVKADVYFNNQARYDNLASLTGGRVCPVDQSQGYIATKADKWGENDDIRRYTQQNIHERFSLNTPNDGDDFPSNSYTVASNASDAQQKENKLGSKK
jgi:hypothetical protein